MPNLSAIILTFSRPDLVPDTVARLRLQSCAEIVIADDGLDAEQCVRLNALGTKRYHRERTCPDGRGTCRNEGAKLTTGDKLLFLDDDCVPAPDLIMRHEQALAHYDVSIGLTVKDWQDKRSDSRLDGYEKEIAPLSWMTHTGNIAMRRSAFWQVGGFDARTFDGEYGWEDTDLGIRLENARRSMYLNYNAIALHLGIACQDADPKRSEVNQAKFMAKRSRAKRVFLVYSGHLVSTLDVGRGWERALRLMGHDVKAYSYHDRIQFYNIAGIAWQEHTANLQTPPVEITQAGRKVVNAWRKGAGKKMELPNLIRLASEGAVAEAIEYRPDVVIIISGLVIDRVLFTVFNALSLPVALILTESPYSDDDQTVLLPYCQAVLTNDKSSLGRLRRFNKNTLYLPHSYDPWLHYPQAVAPEYTHDVFFFGTLYPERKAMLTGMRWTGINASIAGTYILKSGEVKVVRKTRRGLKSWQPNSELAKHYAGSKIGLSWHRTTADYFKGTVIGQDAYSLGPRALEIPACGGFMLCDPTRPELYDVYGDSVPTFDSPQVLLRQVRYWLAHEDERKGLASAQRQAVTPCSFRERGEAILWPAVEALCH